MAWDKETIIHKFYDAVDRGLSQRYQQIFNVLKRSYFNEAFEILFLFFIDENRPTNKKIWDQELAGHILLELMPPCNVDSKKAIKQVLKYYDFSVEQLPWYFSEILGKDNFINILNEIDQEDLSEYERRSLDTFKYWLRYPVERRFYYLKREERA